MRRFRRGRGAGIRLQHDRLARAGVDGRTERGHPRQRSDDAVDLPTLLGQSAVGLREDVVRVGLDASLDRERTTRHALEKGLGSLPPTTSIETTYDTLEITPIAPGVASVLAYYRTTFKDSIRGNATFGGLLTMTVVHRPSGWQFLNGHTSAPPKA